MKGEGCSNLTSAREIVPYILSICPQASSVLDLGCGIGAWLFGFESNGVTDLVGVDGEWLDKNQFLLSIDKLVTANLQEELDLKRKFDIAISLEVAEHLPAEAADTFVDNLVRHSDFIVFGAATPNQGGTHHVNEQKQSYWVKKFSDRGYKCFDLIRGAFENNEKVLYEYWQDTFIYVKESKINEYPKIAKALDIPFLLDVFGSYESFDNTPKSWHWIRRRFNILVKIAIRKLMKKGEYSIRN